MPLTPPESEFLGAFLDEYMSGEAGPATRAVRALGLVAPDYLHLLDAYSRVHPPRLECRDVAGRREEVLVWGGPVPNPPDPPWPNRATVQRRNAEIFTELETTP